MDLFPSSEENRIEVSTELFPVQQLFTITGQQ